MCCLPYWADYSHWDLLRILELADLTTSHYGNELVRTVMRGRLRKLLRAVVMKQNKLRSHRRASQAVEEWNAA